MSACMTHTPPGRPTLCFIDHDALRWNLRQVRDKVGDKVKILSMVKANGYGHDAVAVAQTLASAGSDAFGVATLEEGTELRRANIAAPILVLAGVYLEQVDQLLANKLTPVVHDVDAMKRLDVEIQRRGTTLHVHLKVDTGMGRIGLPAGDVAHWLPKLKKLNALKIAGLFSHFSTAESVEGVYTKKQLAVFADLVAQLRAQGIAPQYCHLANSAATITQPAAYFDMVRPGIMLYGGYPSREMAAQVTLKPVMAWKTRILQLKKVPPGSSISYGQTFVTERESLIATLPIGYADGYSRLLSNRGEALVRGQRARVAGRVCMDLTMLDVTDIANVQSGDEVVLLGRQGGGEITADEMAA
ncbi:MAG: alanine racemase, partial [Deltaproteobacteria bacterium]|nr:alanine racemase [Deltaproteobacteria bacterium]